MPAPNFSHSHHALPRTPLRHVPGCAEHGSREGSGTESVRSLSAGSAVGAQAVTRWGKALLQCLSTVFRPSASDVGSAGGGALCFVTLQTVELVIKLSYPSTAVATRGGRCRQAGILPPQRQQRVARQREQEADKPLPLSARGAKPAPITTSTARGVDRLHHCRSSAPSVHASEAVQKAKVQHEFQRHTHKIQQTMRTFPAASGRPVH